MTQVIRRSADRGYMHHDWLESSHTFSFGEYQDPQYMGFRSLRVINEDRVKPGQGFGTHPHRDMEILTYILSGSLRHQDSAGNVTTLAAGELQVMSAGSGITHSEFNGSRTDSVHFLQIWILPAKTGLSPSYSEWKQPAAPEPAHPSQVSLSLMASPTGSNGSAIIHQNASVWRITLPHEATHSIPLQSERAGWIQLINGAITVNGDLMFAGDGLAIEGESLLELKATVPSTVLWFDLP